MLQGVLPVFQTPFLDNDEIDFATLEREIAWLFERGAHGVVMAMVSELLRLSSEERDLMATRVCQWAGGRGHIVISVGAESTYTAARHARHAEQAGASALMAIPPIAVALDQDELLNYYRALLKAVRVPLIVQDASGYVGRPLPIVAQARLLEEFGSERVFFKPEANPIGPRLTLLRDATRGQARVFEGSGGIALVDSFRRGIVGTMPGAEIIDAQVALWRALEKKDEGRIYQLSPLVASLVALQHGLDGFLAVEKYLLVKQGIFRSARVRGPVGFQLDTETRAEIDRLFDRLQAAL
jgi:4-hydroxy-tetrahydrodipicolinate synthase